MLKILLIIEQCNPDWSSVPLVGYKLYSEIAKLADVTLVTHERNREALDARGHEKVVYIPESGIIHGYYKITSLFINNVWPLYHTLNYPVYAEFNRRVYTQFHQAVRNGEYDIVHALTPIIPRYPVKLIKACQQTPFLLGPVNGGVPYPPGFQNISRKEYGYLNFLREVGRLLIPGYKQTYQQADRILSGSTYTLNLIKQLFGISSDKIELFFENGVDREFLQQERNGSPSAETLRLLFVGRLVPFKGADMLIAALSRLDARIRQSVSLTIVGDGPERAKLERQARQSKIDGQIAFTGWLRQPETMGYYRQSDLFCLPSVREFGGAVVLEAMACGLPCLVVDHGGIGEYVTEGTGIKIAPHSREHVIDGLVQAIERLFADRKLLQDYSARAVIRAQEFEWSKKARELLGIYGALLGKSGKN